jgi:predicted amidohydrolase|tara:strand:- start:75 stop:419 length:345 start_codon:yes stop_codon:yes gene_type:complete
MKKLLLIILLSCSFLNSQGLSDEDMVKLANAIKNQKELLAAYEIQIDNYRVKVSADSVVINNQDSLIADLELQVENYKKYSKNIKPSWYENKWLYYSYGVLTVVGNVWLYDKVK